MLLNEPRKLSGLESKGITLPLVQSDPHIESEMSLQQTRAQTRTSSIARIPRREIRSGRRDVDAFRAPRLPLWQSGEHAP